jgi:TonB family protein
MIPFIVKSSLIAVLTFAAVYLLRRQSAATRHMVLTIGLVCTLVLPLLGKVLPEWHPAPIAGYSYDVPALHVTPEIGKTSVPQSNNAPPAQVLPGLDRYLLWIWLAGAVIVAASFLVGFARVKLLLRAAQPVTSHPIARVAKEIAVALNLRRPIRLLQNQGEVLGTWGVLRPQLLLPLEANHWDEERLRIVLAHELAHVKRIDWLVQMLAESARVIYWFNPLFWLLCRHLRLESELACDDVVLNLGTDGKKYAAHLLDIARAMKNSGRAWSPILAMAQSPNLERRFLAMLNLSLNHGRISRKFALSSFVIAISLTASLAAVRAPEQAASRVAAPAVVTTATTVTAPKSPAPIRRTAQPKSSPTTKPVAPQLEFGSLSGTIYDPTGAVVPGVTVAAWNLKTRATEYATSGPLGEFEFPRLETGEYEYVANAPGFVTFRGGSATIQASQDLKQKVTLLLGNIIQRVTVTASGQPNTTFLPPGTPRRIRVGGNVQAANLIAQVRPVYPPSAQSTGVEGTVLLEGIISTDGTFQSLRVLSSIDRDLTTAAMEAVKQWRYRPTLLNGEPVEVLTTINVDFKLTQ